MSGPHGDALKKPQEKIEWIARTISEIDADITMLCEMGGLDSLDLFNTKYLNSQYYTSLLKGNSDRGIEMGYLIKKNVTAPRKYGIYILALLIQFLMCKFLKQ